MWRVIPFLAVVCLCGTLFGQPLIEPREEQVPFDAHQIEQAAVKSFADLEAKVIKLEAENESLRQQIRELTKGKEPTPAVDKAARNLAKLALDDVAGVHKASYDEIEKAVGELVEANNEPHLVLISSKQCSRCPEAKRLVRAWAQKIGLSYDEIEHPESKPGKTYPYFRFCWGLNCEEFDSSVTGLGDAIAARAKKWGAKVDFKPLQFVPRQAARQSTEWRAPRKLWGQHEGHYTQSVENMTIEYHLTHAPHFIDITGMTVAEMEAKHQELHR